MSDEEIMKKFNEQFSNNAIDGNNKKENNPTPYRVGENLNNMINENTIKMLNSVKSDPSLNPVNNVVNYNMVNNNIQPSNINANVNNNNLNTYNNNVNYNYVPIDNTKKAKKPTIKLTSDALALLLILVILLAFIFITPNIYDFIRQIKMK